MKLINKLYIIIAITLACLAYSQIPAFSNQLANQNIRIGLFFNSTALPQAQIKASNLNILNENNSVLGTIFGDASYTVSTVNKEIILLDKTYYDLNTALIEIQTSGGLLNNNFVYLSSDGYKMATYSIQADNVFSMINSKNIGLFSSAGNPIIVYDNSMKLKFSNSDYQKHIEIQNKPYRGNISFQLDSSNKLTVINTLPIEDYLYGVVAKEMPASWNKEALKAQAISARNYAIKNLNKYKSLGFDLCTTQNSQVYGGVDAEHVNTNKAVDETRGILAYYSGNIADLFYHSSSGGKTENSENIWSNAVPYLRGVEDPYSLGSPNDYWEYKISKSEIENLLKNKGKNIGNFLGVRIDKISENERIIKLTFVGDSGETTIEKEAIRGLFGYSNLKSNWFTINSQNTKNTQSIVSDSYIAALNDLQLFLNKSESNKINGYSNLSNNDIITSQDYLFQGKGYGHGLGMSQYGAKKMAEQGYTFDEILKYYFKGIDVY